MSVSGALHQRCATPFHGYMVSSGVDEHRNSRASPHLVLQVDSCEEIDRRCRDRDLRAFRPMFCWSVPFVHGQPHPFEDRACGLRSHARSRCQHGASGCRPGARRLVRSVVRSEQRADFFVVPGRPSTFTNDGYDPLQGLVHSAVPAMACRMASFTPMGRTEKTSSACLSRTTVGFLSPSIKCRPTW